MSEGNTANRGAETPYPMAPFDAWAEWMRANMGAVSAAPGASVPWLMSPGVSTGEEIRAVARGGHTQRSSALRLREALGRQPIAERSAHRLDRDHTLPADPVGARDVRPGARHRAGHRLQHQALRDHDAQLAGGHQPPLGPRDAAGRRRRASRQAVLRARLGAEPLLRDAQGELSAGIRVPAGGGRRDRR